MRNSLEEKDVTAKEYAEEYIKRWGIVEILSGLVTEIENLEKENKELKERKVRRGCKHKMFGEDDKAKMKKLKKDGYSLRKIAEIMGCNEKTVRNYLKQS